MVEEESDPGSCQHSAFGDSIFMENVIIHFLGNSGESIRYYGKYFLFYQKWSCNMLSLRNDK